MICQTKVRDMPKKQKSWREKLESTNPSHGKICKILIPKPLDVDAIIRTIPKGKLMTDEQIRQKLAKDNGADATCSKVTGIFLRIAAEVAEEDRNNGKTQITPYWRVIAKDGYLKPKFPGGVEAQAAHLKEEGYSIILDHGKKPPKVKDFEKDLVKL